MTYWPVIWQINTDRFFLLVLLIKYLHKKKLRTFFVLVRSIFLFEESLILFSIRRQYWMIEKKEKKTKWIRLNMHQHLINHHFTWHKLSICTQYIIAMNTSEIYWEYLLCARLIYLRIFMTEFSIAHISSFFAQQSRNRHIERRNKTLRHHKIFE